MNIDLVINSDCPHSLRPQQLIAGYSNAYLNLFKCLGYTDTHMPIADWLRLYHGLQESWIIVSPIHWQATHNDAMLLACDRELHCSEDDARCLFDKFSALAAEDGMQTFFHDRYTWLLSCKGKPAITSIAPHAFLHQSMFPQIKQLDETFYWQRFVTEAQMLFSAQSSISSSTLVNGIWIWGSGLLDRQSNRLLLVTDEGQCEMAKLLSQHTQNYIKSEPLPKHALLWINSLNERGLRQLAVELGHRDVNWYWNNLSYHTKKISWLSRLLSFKRES
jgi:hypothetical protein